MKFIKTFNIFLIILTLFYFDPIEILVAISPTPIPSSSPPPTVSVVNELKKIEDLKEKIATKVAQLRENEKRAATGTVKTLEKNILVLSTTKGEINILLSDDILVFSFTGGGKTEVKIASIKIGSDITVFGYLNQDKNTLSAKFIYIRPSAKIRIVGKISDIDRDNYTISIKDKGEDLTVDIETSTKISSYSREKGSVKSGFSKLRVGDSVHIMAIPNSSEKNRSSATRIITFLFDSLVSPTVIPTSSPSAAIEG